MIKNYFDFAATTPLDPRLVEIWKEYSALPLNPSSIHQSGQKARRLLETARERIAEALDADAPSDILFTSGATESANLALRGLVQMTSEKKRVVTSALEHSCISETLEALEKEKLIEVTEFSLTESGFIEYPQHHVGADIFCLMHANNETGTIQNTQRAKAFRDESKSLWVCDVSQSIGKLPVSLKAIDADLFLISAHKFYGPPGIGCLAGPGLKKLRPQIVGGPQEDNRRAGTQAVALALCFAEALEFAQKELHERTLKLDKLEAIFLDELKNNSVPFLRNGETPRLPGFINLSFQDREGVDLVIALDQMGFQVSPGSACSTGVVAVSPVLAAMFPSDELRAAGGLRVTLSHHTTEDEVIQLAQAITKILTPSPSKFGSTH